MKKIIVLLMLIISVKGSGQVLQKPAVYGYEFRRLAVDTLFDVPADTFSVPASLQSFPFIARKGTSFYFWNTSTHVWAAFSAAGATPTWQQTLTAGKDKEVASKNVAAVIITASLPPFARAGNKIDITVNSIGDATSLAGGTLIQSPLRAADQNTYAVAQGSLLIGTGPDSHSTSGRIPNGAIIERDVAEDFTSRKMFRLTLHNPDFTTAARLAKRINMDLSGKYATAKDAGTVDIIVPFSYEGRAVELLATIGAGRHARLTRTCFGERKNRNGCDWRYGSNFPRRD